MGEERGAHLVAVVRPVHRRLRRRALAHNKVYAHEWLFSTFSELAFSSDGVGGASLRGGMRSFIASRPFASANDVILWLGEKPCRAKRRKNIWISEGIR